MWLGFLGCANAVICATSCCQLRPLRVYWPADLCGSGLACHRGSGDAEGRWRNWLLHLGCLQRRGDTSTSQIILAIFYVGVVGLILDRLVGMVGDRISGGGR